MIMKQRTLRIKVGRTADIKQKDIKCWKDIIETKM